MKQISYWKIDSFFEYIVMVFSLFSANDGENAEMSEEKTLREHVHM
jgi:hypothetical protein